MTTQFPNFPADAQPQGQVPFVGVPKETAAVMPEDRRQLEVPSAAEFDSAAVFLPIHGQTLTGSEAASPEGGF